MHYSLPMHSHLPEGRTTNGCHPALMIGVASSCLPFVKRELENPILSFLRRLESILFSLLTTEYTKHTESVIPAKAGIFFSCSDKRPRMSQYRRDACTH